MSEYEILVGAMDDSFNDFDMSWVMQVPSLEYKGQSMDVNSGDLEDISMNFVSLEEEGGDGKEQVLYDNIVCEDILSDEEVDML